MARPTLYIQEVTVHSDPPDHYWEVLMGKHRMGRASSEQAARDIAKSGDPTPDKRFWREFAVHAGID